MRRQTVGRCVDGHEAQGRAGTFDAQALALAIFLVGVVSQEAGGVGHGAGREDLDAALDVVDDVVGALDVGRAGRVGRDDHAAEGDALVGQADPGVMARREALIGDGAVAASFPFKRLVVPDTERTLIHDADVEDAGGDQLGESLLDDSAGHGVG